MLLQLCVIGNLLITLFALFFCLRLSTIYSTFNRNVKSWIQELDRTSNAAINRQAMLILKQMDEKLTANNLNTCEHENNSPR